ncbi:MAG: phosphonate C-P lyase system protein PhnH [Deltaproteobacteria bacterium]|jgi:alpha-D-ribose 1-methylphosphonate 5-triphosphate synthase subunit PhnH|nr:phosphonate C-P lyase system protein PhnH [Deltaproteobacteria bacterium]
MSRSEMLGNFRDLGLGFKDPALSAQAAFRAALRAFAAPALPVEMDFASLFQAPPPLPAEMAALALVLADGEASVYLSPSLKDAGTYLSFHGGVAKVAPEEAFFVFAAAEAEAPPLALLRQGSEKAPDESATLILGGALTGKEGGVKYWASGPGIKEPRLWAPRGLSASFLAERGEIVAAYPLGIDIFLTGPNLLMGLPRTTLLERA